MNADTKTPMKEALERFKKSMVAAKVHPDAQLLAITGFVNGAYQAAHIYAQATPINPLLDDLFDEIKAVAIAELAAVNTVIEQQPASSFQHPAARN